MSSYDWFTFYLRTTYACVVLTLWCMDQPKQCYKLVTQTFSQADNFLVDKTFVQVHLLLVFATILFFVVNIRTNYLIHVVQPFELCLFCVLVAGNFAIYYIFFIRKSGPSNGLDLSEQTGSEIQAEMDEQNSAKTIKILLWITTLMTIGKMIVTPLYVFYSNPDIIAKNPETYLFLININNELLLYTLVLVLFAQFLSQGSFFSLSSLSFGSFEELLASLKNTFKIYVLNVIFLTFIASKSKSHFLMVVYGLCFITSVTGAYYGRKYQSVDTMV